MPKTLAKSHYQNLLSEISKIYQTAQAQVAVAANQIRNKAYWQIGKRIVEVEQEHEVRAQYGEQMIENLSKDLTEKYGVGFSVSNLQYMRRFYSTHQIPHARGELDWTHHKLLLKIRDDKKREFYEDKTVKEGWSTRQLQEVLHDEEVEMVRILADGEVDTPEGEAEDAAAGGNGGSPQGPRIPIQRGQLYQCEIVRSDSLHPKPGFVCIDCGFEIRNISFLRSGSQWQAGDWVKFHESEDGFRFTRSQAAPRERYTYKALVERVIDGDTLLVHIDCGFGIWSHQRLRLRHIDAPALATVKGEKAKQFVQSLLKKTHFIIIKTYWHDRYDRYLVDVFYLPEEENEEKVVHEGRLLNQEILDEGLAVAFK